MKPACTFHYLLRDRFQHWWWWGCCCSKYIYIYRPYRNVLQWPSDDEQKETKWGRWKLTIIYLLKRLFVPSVRRRIVKSKYVESYQYIRENIEYSSSERASNTIAVSITRKMFRFYIYISFVMIDWKSYVLFALCEITLVEWKLLHLYILHTILLTWRTSNWVICLNWFSSEIMHGSFQVTSIYKYSRSDRIYFFNFYVYIYTVVVDVVCF